MNSVVTLKTLLPLSLVIMIIVATLHFAGIKALANSNAEHISELKLSRSKTNDQINEINKTLYSIDGKIDLILNSK